MRLRLRQSRTMHQERLEAHNLLRLSNYRVRIFVCCLHDDALVHRVKRNRVLCGQLRDGKLDFRLDGPQHERQRLLVRNFRPAPARSARFGLPLWRGISAN